MCLIWLYVVVNFIGNTGSERTATSEEINKILERHNHWRKEVGVSDLAWSEELAEIADQWARNLKKDKCGFYHSEYGFGENLWKGTTGYYSVSDAVDSWASEKKDYNHKRNKCRAGAVCGHYTQLVWASTTYVGCAKVECDGYTIWVCEYDPPGNWDGEKPY